MTDKNAQCALKSMVKQFLLTKEVGLLTLFASGIFVLAISPVDKVRAFNQFMEIYVLPVVLFLLALVVCIGVWGGLLEIRNKYREEVLKCERSKAEREK